MLLYKRVKQGPAPTVSQTCTGGLSVHRSLRLDRCGGAFDDADLSAQRHIRPGSMAKLEIDDVVMGFGDVVAVDHASLTVADGETVVLLGPSGCGKTTLLRLIAGFYRPNSGAIRINGKTVASPTADGAAGKAFALDGVPELRGVAAQDRVRKPRLWAAAARPRRQDDRGQDRGCARHGAHGRLCGALSERVVGRPAAARGSRARAGARAGNPAVRRAAEQSRRHAARAHALRDQGAARASSRSPQSTSPTTRTRRWLSPTASR